jgi:hypothetical protein
MPVADTFPAVQGIRVLLEGICAEVSAPDLRRPEGIHPSIFYKWNPVGRCLLADPLSVEKAVRRAGSRLGSPVHTDPRKKHLLEALGGRSDAESGRPANMPGENSKALTVSARGGVSERMSPGKRDAGLSGASRHCGALTIVGAFTRDCVAIEIGQALKGTDMEEVLSRLQFERSAPKIFSRSEAREA